MDDQSTAARRDTARPDEVRPVTSLFADVVGSTALGERLGPEEIRALIGECVSRLCETVETFGGRVGAYMGDGIAAFFGLEVALEDDVHRAVRAGTEILRVMDVYAEEVRTAWGIDDFSVRVGINQGRVAVGSVGAADPRTLALGDPVNIAARLQAAARPGSIVVGGSVADQIRGSYDVVPLGSIKVKGRSRAVEAFELGVAPGLRPGRVSPFVGRHDEIARLDVVIDELREGRGQITVVVGDGGLGKTRLVEELRQRAPSDILWLDVRCDPIDHRLPYEAFAAPLRAWLGIDDRATSIEVRVRLIARGRPLLGEDFDAIAPGLARLLGVSLDVRADRRLDGFPGDVLTSSLLASYEDWLKALSAHSPVVLAIDNLDGASTATVEFATSLLDLVSTDPVLIACTMRPVPGDPAWSLRVRALSEFPGRTVSVDLQPLSPDEADALIAASDSDDVLTPRLRDVVKARAEGNPLFIGELIGAIVDQGESSAELPSALEGLLLARIDSLTANSKAVLQAAAVLGRVFRHEVLARMDVAPDADDAIADLLRIELIRERGRRPLAFSFRHGLLRDAALATLTEARVRELNRRAAAALRESQFDEDRDVEALARYYLAAGESREAIECYERLAHRLEMVFRYEEAAGLLEECVAELELEPEERWRLTRLQTELLIRARQFDEALRLLDQLHASACSEVDRAQVALTQARALYEVGRVPEALAAVRASRVVAVEGEMEARALIMEGQIGLELGDLTSAADCAREVALEALSPDVAFEAASLRAGVAVFSGELQEAERWALRAQALADQTGNLPNQLTGKRHLALICLLKGYVGEAYELMRSVHDQYREVGDVTGQVDCAPNLIHLAILVGALDDGATVARAALAAAAEGPWMPMLKANLAVIEYERGNFDDATNIANALLARDCSRHTRVVALLTLAAICEARGDIEGASDLVDEAERVDVLTPQEWAMIASVRADLADIQRDPLRALEHSEHALAEAQKCDPIQGFLAQRVYAEMSAKVTGNSEPLRRVIVEANRMGMVLQEGYGLLALGEVEPAQRTEHFERARQIFASCGGERGLAALRVGESRLAPAR